VYCGIYSLEKVRSVLEDKFGQDPESFDARSDGESCLFAFSVTDDGRPLFDTFVLSTCAWATARTLDPGPESAEWLVGFETIASTIAAGFAERLAASQDDPRGQELTGKGFNLGRPLQYADILRETQRIAQDLGVPELSENSEIRIKAGVVSSRKKYSADDQDFLNSFFVKDLEKVAAEVRQQNLGKGLMTFLTGDDELDLSKRIDVRKSIDTLFQHLSPALFPPGRWPSNGHHPLVFSQQFGMNSMVQDLMKGSGLFAVNGPPGTGKTTLLRDLIAAVVVERATRLAKLARAENAFAGEKRWEVLIEQVERHLPEGKNQVAARQQAVALLDQKIQQTTSEIEQKRQWLAAAREELHNAQVRLGAHFPLPDTWHKEAKARELSSPWADPEWNTARAKVFLEALHLHKAFIAANAETMRKSLQGAMDVLSGAVAETAPPEGVEAAWTTLSFVIPVISTTFASFDRLFAHLGRESLGWLLIDEAGQAVPQAAAGAIWRAKRSVVVGDPLQLEPVITIPFTVQRALHKYYKVDETWLPGSTSVQQLTDRVGVLGTYLKGPDGPIWVGSPLRVHRRCDRPMFDISNTVAYDGLMAFGTPPRPAIALPPSSWIHVESPESEGHWIPAEGRVVETLIGNLMSQGISADDIFLISPFRVVMRRLRQIASRFDIQAGTIHTAQGKESEVVILVLGGDPRRPGAKQWASTRPNLLNVAVSRAKRRLYVVGNQEAWRQYRYFGVCAAVLQQWNVAGFVTA
jgi:hypothetical protein